MNREKVIKGIDICLHSFNCEEDCPYYDDCLGLGCMEQLREDVLSMLKEQEDALEQMRLDNTDLRNCNAELLKEREAMEPIEEFRKGANCHVYHCKRCGNIVGTILGGKRPIAKLSIEHFCNVCGQAVKWDSRRKGAI